MLRAIAARRCRCHDPQNDHTYIRVPRHYKPFLPDNPPRVMRNKQAIRCRRATTDLARQVDHAEINQTRLAPHIWFGPVPSLMPGSSKPENYCQALASPSITTRIHSFRPSSSYE